MSVLCSEFRKYARERGLKIHANVVLYEICNGTAMVVGSATILNVVVADPDEFQRRPHGLSQNRESVSDVLIINALVFQKGSSPISFCCEFRCTSLEYFLETLRNVSEYALYVW